MTLTQIDRFDGSEFEWLSNFYPARVTFDGEVYATVEHAYQAAKTLDPDDRRFVRSSSTPGQAKRRGRAVKARSDWDEVKTAVMTDLVGQKFALGSTLAEALLNTGRAELIEGNTWGDRFWGRCGGVGLNHLGRILMNRRDALILELLR